MKDTQLHVDRIYALPLHLFGAMTKKVKKFHRTLHREEFSTAGWYKTDDNVENFGLTNTFIKVNSPVAVSGAMEHVAKSNNVILLTHRRWLLHTHARVSKNMYTQVRRKQKTKKNTKQKTRETRTRKKQQSGEKWLTLRRLRVANSLSSSIFSCEKII